MTQDKSDEDFDQATFHVVRDCPFFLASKKLLRNKSLSLGCLALILFVLSFEGIEEVSLERIFKRFPKDETESEVQSFIDEALQTGFLKLQNGVISVTSKVNEI